jgi:hypothetical protein
MFISVIQALVFPANWAKRQSAAFRANFDHDKIGQGSQCGLTQRLCIASGSNTRPSGGKDARASCQGQPQCIDFQTLFRASSITLKARIFIVSATDEPTCPVSPFTPSGALVQELSIIGGY